MATTAKRGWAAITANPITPPTAIPGGNHAAGRRSDGQANHNAAITNPTRPVAEATKRAVPSVPNCQLTKPQIASSAIAKTNTVTRRQSSSDLLDDSFVLDGVAIEMTRNNKG